MTGPIVIKQGKRIWLINTKKTYTLISIGYRHHKGPNIHMTARYNLAVFATFNPKSTPYFQSVESELTTTKSNNVSCCTSSFFTNRNNLVRTPYQPYFINARLPFNNLPESNWITAHAMLVIIQTSR